MIVRTASVDELPQIEAMYAAIVDAMIASLARDAVGRRVRRKPAGGG